MYTKHLYASVCFFFDTEQQQTSPYDDFGCSRYTNVDSLSIMR